jgi:hypothetical protein
MIILTRKISGDRHFEGRSLSFSKAHFMVEANRGRAIDHWFRESIAKWGMRIIRLDK